MEILYELSLCTIMDHPVYKGKISYINYEKEFATIEYMQGAKLKSVNCKTHAPDNGKKPKQYRLGDGVSFQLKLSDRGDKMTAYNVKFIHNEAIDLLIQKASIENRFSGYLKMVDDKYFVKEWESYILFPLQLSPWEKPPVETATNEAISFRLINLEKPTTIAAELFSHNFIPEFFEAKDHFTTKKPAMAIVSKVSPHAVYLNLFNGKIQAKLPFAVLDNDPLKEGEILPVIITHITNTRIVVKKAEI